MRAATAAGEHCLATLLFAGLTERLADLAVPKPPRAE